MVYEKHIEELIVMAEDKSTKEDALEELSENDDADVILSPE